MEKPRDPPRVRRFIRGLESCRTAPWMELGPSELRVLSHNINMAFLRCAFKAGSFQPIALLDGLMSQTPRPMSRGRSPPRRLLPEWHIAEMESSTRIDVLR